MFQAVLGCFSGKRGSKAKSADAAAIAITKPTRGSWEAGLQHMSREALEDYVKRLETYLERTQPLNVSNGADNAETSKDDGTEAHAENTRLYLSASSFVAPNLRWTTAAPANCTPRAGGHTGGGEVKLDVCETTTGDMPVLCEHVFNKELRDSKQPVAVLVVSTLSSGTSVCGLTVNIDSDVATASTPTLANEVQVDPVSDTIGSQHSGRGHILHNEPGTHSLEAVYINNSLRDLLHVSTTEDYNKFLANHLLKDPSLPVVLEDLVRRLLKGELTNVKHFLQGDFGDDRYFLSIMISPCAYRDGAGVLSPAMLLQHNVPYTWDELSQRMQRDHLILSHIPSMVTIVDLNGQVLHQNCASIAYMGYVTGTDVKGSQDPKKPGNILYDLFSLDANKYSKMIDTVHMGKVWQAVMRMPVCLTRSHRVRRAPKKLSTRAALVVQELNKGVGVDDMRLSFCKLSAPDLGTQLWNKGSDFFTSLRRHSTAAIDWERSCPNLGRMSQVSGHSCELEQAGQHMSNEVPVPSHQDSLRRSYSDVESVESAGFQELRPMQRPLKKMLTALVKNGHRPSQPRQVLGEHNDGDSDLESRRGHNECWHEVVALTMLDFATNKRCIMLIQTDVSKRVRLERRVEGLLEAEHKMLTEIFPRHVIEHITKRRSSVVAPPAPLSSALSEDFHCSLLQELRNPRTALATKHEEVTVLFADIVGFTSMCSQADPTVVMEFLNLLYTRFDSLLDLYGVYKVETIGDCYMVAGGLVTRDMDGFRTVRKHVRDPIHATRVVCFAKAMLKEARHVQLPMGGGPVQLRVGVHSGAVVSGIVGTKMPRFCLFGDTINTASRMESTGRAGCIHASATTHALLEEQGWTPSGGVHVKGKGTMDTFIWHPLSQVQRRASVDRLALTHAARGVAGGGGNAHAPLSLWQQDILERGKSHSFSERMGQGLPTTPKLPPLRGRGHRLVPLEAVVGSATSPPPPNLLTHVSSHGN